MDISIVEMLWNPLSGITDALGDMFDGLITKFLSMLTFIPSVILYALQLGFFYLIDCVQTIFRKMAGLDTYYVDGQAQSGDIVMSMLQNQIIVNIFIAVLVVSIMLLFVTTFVAIIRVEFTEKGAGNAKGPIIGRAVKSLAYFAIVPITCLFGIWISNVFLRSFDKATSGNSYSLSTTVFFAASQDANRVRNSTKVANAMKEDNPDLLKVLGLSGTFTQEEFALAIDNAFRQKLTVEEAGYSGEIQVETGGNAFAYYWAAKTFAGHDDFSFSVFDTNDMFLVMYFYDLFTGYNYLIGFVGGYMAASLLFSSVIGLIQRLYELAILFIISPAAVAFMPLDDGKKYNSWRGEFIKRVGMAYGPVIGLNLMFQILAMLQHVTLFPGGGFMNSLFNAIVQLLFLIVGLLSIKEFSGIISNMVGSNDAMSVGEGKKKDTIAMGNKMIAGQVAAARTGWAFQKAAYHSAAKPLATRRAGHKFDKEHVKDIRDLANDRNEQKRLQGLADSTSDPVLKKLYQNSADVAKQKADEKEAKLKEARDTAVGAAEDKHAKNFGSQFNQMLKGEGAKTEAFGALGDLMKSAGPLGQFSREKVAERGKNGQSTAGQFKIWAAAHDDKGNDNKLKNWQIIGQMVPGLRRSKAFTTDENKNTHTLDTESVASGVDKKGDTIDKARKDSSNRHSAEIETEARMLAETEGKNWKKMTKDEQNEYIQRVLDEGKGGGPGGPGGTTTVDGAVSIKDPVKLDSSTPIKLDSSSLSDLKTALSEVKALDSKMHNQLAGIARIAMQIFTAMKKGT